MNDLGKSKLKLDWTGIITLYDSRPEFEYRRRSVFTRNFPLRHSCYSSRVELDDCYLYNYLCSSSRTEENFTIDICMMTNIILRTQCRFTPILYEKLIQLPWLNGNTSRKFNVKFDNHVPYVTQSGIVPIPHVILSSINIQMQRSARC